ncbi:hypothetical protein [Dyadobacter diqingensis]|uniref:hypothetical protein n=1 Tax=Dyadobacter diqingensis TaxID=2938121 RepID=UPI0020C37B11|nr:hypothetical protein [Dyadobacter diqingensis]
MTKAIIEVSGNVELFFDENSKEFQEAFESYKDCINNTATVDDMLKHVAHNIIRFGDERMVEGVGYIGLDGRNPNKLNYSGITVDSMYDNFDLDVIDKTEE